MSQISSSAHTPGGPESAARDFNVPQGAVSRVSIINTEASISCLPTGRLMSPPLPGFQYMPAFPSLSFLVEASTGQRALFDLGISKNWDQNAPIIADRLAANGYQIKAAKNVADVLEQHDIDLNSISSIVWRCVPCQVTSLTSDATMPPYMACQR